nr:hypothetical protein [Tanacetum cinerariifolium]
MAAIIPPPQIRHHHHLQQPQQPTPTSPQPSPATDRVRLVRSQQAIEGFGFVVLSTRVFGFAVNSSRLAPTGVFGSIARLLRERLAGCKQSL